MRTARVPRRGLQDIRTRTNQTTDAEAPQRKFLRLADLELKRSLCSRVREAAARRVAEMDKQLAEITEEQARMLRAIDVFERAGSPPSASQLEGGPCEIPLVGGFTLKYGSRLQGAGRDDADVSQANSRWDERKHLS